MTADRLHMPRQDDRVELLDDEDIGLPAALAAIVFILAVAAGIGIALWLAAHQCIRIGGCG